VKDKNSKDKQDTTGDKKKGRGQPPYYETPEELDKAIGKFFTDRSEAGKPPTQAGLALYLGFESRQSLWDYKTRKDFSYVIKKALLMIEDFHEGRLMLSQCTGSIVWLNAWAGYAQKIEQKHTGSFRMVASDVDEKL